MVSEKHHRRIPAALAAKAALTALVFPGTVTVFIPYLLIRRAEGAAEGLLRWPGVPLIVFGAAVLARCIWEFAATGRGTLAPVDPPKRLVVRGLYRYVRNPMYVGVSLILLGEATVFGSFRLLAYAAAYVLLVNIFVIAYEEPALRKQFGQSYVRYCRRVNRWLPRRPHT